MTSYDMLGVDSDKKRTQTIGKAQCTMLYTAPSNSYVTHSTPESFAGNMYRGHNNNMAD